MLAIFWRKNTSWTTLHGSAHHEASGQCSKARQDHLRSITWPAVCHVAVYQALHFTARTPLATTAEAMHELLDCAVDVTGHEHVRLLQEGEELTITYGTVWFEDRNMQSRREDGEDPMHHHMDDPDSFLGAVML